MVTEYLIQTSYGAMIMQHHIPSNTKNFPTILLMTGDSPRGFSGASCQRLLPVFIENGYGVVVFDFCGLGKNSGKRENLTLTQGIQDFNTALTKFWTLENIDYNKIVIFATSFGASVALACSNLVNKFKGVILRSPCPFLPEAYLNEIGFNKYDEWEKTKFCKENGYNIKVLLDPLNYNLYAMAKNIKTNCKIIYGGKDEIVPAIQTKLLLSVLNTDKDVYCVENADHGYSINNSFDEMQEIIIKWLKELL